VGHDFTQAIREVTSLVQILIYRRETTPIRDRTEAQAELLLRVQEVGKSANNGKIKWRRSLLEMAAYCIFSAVSDE